MLIPVTALIPCRCPEDVLSGWLLYGAVPLVLVVITALLQLRRSGAARQHADEDVDAGSTQSRTGRNDARVTGGSRSTRGR